MPLSTAMIKAAMSKDQRDAKIGSRGWDATFPLDQAGFTLLELLAVIALSGFLALLASNHFANMLPGRALRKSAYDFIAYCRAARSDAISGSTETSVLIDRQRGTFRRSGSASEHTLPPGVTMMVVDGIVADNAASPSAIRFFPDGTTSGDDVLLRRGGLEAIVRIDWLTGSIRLEQGD